MTDAVEIHLASEAERLEAYQQVHEAWGKGKRRSVFVADRLKSIQHNRASWWVLTQKKKVCASLGCYPLTFSARGREVPGFGFGAVYTAPRHRQRGYAEQLCRHVAATQQASGCEVGLLFSDIAPDYYAKMGWQALDRTLYYAELVDLWEPTRGLGVRMDEPAARIAELDTLWEAEQAQRALWLKRPEDYWRYLLARSSDDHHVMLCDRSGAERGYLRVSIQGELAQVEEVLMRRGPADPWIEEAWVVVAHYAASQGAERVQTWQTPPPRTRQNWRVKPREQAIPMLLLSGEAARAPDEGAPSLIESAFIHSTDHF
jgi:predicted acetyltransferase